MGWLKLIELASDDKNCAFTNVGDTICKTFNIVCRPEDKTYPFNFLWVIHSLRVVFKKFRYLVEIIHPYLKNYSMGNFERMHHYQDMMGNIQDAEVFLTSFLEYVEEHAKDIEKEKVIEFYTKKLNTLIADFMENKGELNVFWKHNQPLQKEK